MKRPAILLAMCVIAAAADKKLPSGEGANEAVSLSAVVLDADAMTALVGAGLEKDYSALEVTVRPKGGAYEVKLDDFILWSESNSEHSAPLLAAQIAGTGIMFVKTDDPQGGGGKRGGIRAGLGGGMIGSGSIAGPTTMNTEMKDEVPAASQLDMLKKKILVEGSVNGPVNGLLFFPFKEKARSLSLQYKTPSGILRLRFK